MRFLIVFAFFVFLSLGAIAAGVWGLNIYAQKTGPLQQDTIVLIEPGTGVRAMADKFVQEGVLHEPHGFLAVVALRQMAGRLQAGEYAVGAGTSILGLLEKLRKGDVVRRLVTIPEGVSAFEVVQILNNTPELEGEVAVPPEGSILPETYAYMRGESREALVLRMQKALKDEVERLWPHRAEGLPYKSVAEALVMASVVEKETGVVAERERVAGVFVNRLRAGMRLQSDPTVIYAITGGQDKIERVLYAHLEVDSPYNTYKYVGLPPTPIANSGKAAIAAALNPENHDYMYFVADGTGGHVFAKTLAEHNANVRRWRAIQRGR